MKTFIPLKADADLKAFIRRGWDLTPWIHSNGAPGTAPRVDAKGAAIEPSDKELDMWVRTLIVTRDNNEGMELLISSICFKNVHLRFYCEDLVIYVLPYWNFHTDEQHRELLEGFRA